MAIKWFEKRRQRLNELRKQRELQKEKRHKEKEERQEERTKDRRKFFASFKNTVLGDEAGEGLVGRLGGFYKGIFGQVKGMGEKVMEMSPLGQFAKMGEKAKPIIIIVGGLMVVLVLITVLKGTIKTKTAGLL